MSATKKLLPLLAIAAVGCTGFDPTRSLALDSYNATHRPNPQPTWGGDPYAFGGIADGSGGIKPRTAMATSSDGYDFRKQSKAHVKWKSGDDQRPKDHAHYEEGHEGKSHESKSEEAHEETPNEGTASEKPTSDDVAGHTKAEADH